jgi:hypothetical protein
MTTVGHSWGRALEHVQFEFQSSWMEPGKKVLARKYKKPLHQELTVNAPKGYALNSP